MPPEPRRNCRRLMPSFLLASSASSSIRASTRFCCVGLRHRHVLAVGDHPRRDGRAERLRHVRALALGHLLLVEQSVVLFPDATRFVPLFNGHVLPPAAVCDPSPKHLTETSALGLLVFDTSLVSSRCLPLQGRFSCPRHALVRPLRWRSSSSDSLPLFLKKLQDKHQSELQRKRAQQRKHLDGLRASRRSAVRPRSRLWAVDGLTGH